MRILVLTNLYPRPGRATLAPFNRQQFAAMARLGHDLAVLAPVAWTEELRDRRAGHPPIRAYRTAQGIEVRHPRFWFSPGILRHRYGEFFLASIRGAARRLIREHRPEAILSCWAHPDGWAAARIAREHRLPLVTKVVGSDVLVAGRSPRRRVRIAEALRQADAVAAVSQNLAAHVEALGVAPERVHVVREGLDRSLFRPGDRDQARARLGLPLGVPIVLFVGNLLRSKGADVLIEAMGHLAQDLHLVRRCVMVGRGRDEAWLRSLVVRLGLDEVVHWVGSVPQDELSWWYHACDVLALPSDSEGIPNVLGEAAACGRPSIATRVGGIPEVAEALGCRLVPPRSPQALAVAIREILAAPAPPCRVDLPSWSNSAENLVGVIRSAQVRPAPESLDLSMPRNFPPFRKTLAP